MNSLCIDTQRCHTEMVAKKIKLPAAACPKCGGEIRCAGCGTPLLELGRKFLLGLAGSILRSRSTANSAKPEILTPCKWCGVEYGVAAMRTHRPECPDRPPGTPVGRRDSLPRVPAKRKRRAVVA